jgi:hypothetical protein
MNVCTHCGRHIESNDIPDQLHHGTSRQRYENMIREGETTSVLYLAEDIDMAEMYAYTAAQEDETRTQTAEAVSVVFRTQDLIANGDMGPDWDDVRVNLELFEARRVEDVLWTESLDILGTCSYTGPIQPEWVERIKSLE